MYSAYLSSNANHVVSDPSNMQTKVENSTAEATPLCSLNDLHLPWQLNTQWLGTQGPSRGQGNKASANTTPFMIPSIRSMFWQFTGTAMSLSPCHYKNTVIWSRALEIISVIASIQTINLIIHDYQLDARLDRCLLLYTKAVLHINTTPIKLDWQVFFFPPS